MMRTAEPELTEHLRQRSLRFETRIDSWLGTELLATHVPFRDGVITEDATSNVGGTLTLDVPADPEWTPDGNRGRHPLGDLGQRLHVTRYVVTADQQRRPIVMGWWRIEESPVEDESVKVKAVELWDEAVQYEIIAPLQPSTVSHWRALEDVLASTVPLPRVIPPTLTDRAFPESIYDGERLTALTAVLTSLGATARLDQCGVVEVRPDPSLGVVAAFRDGVGGTLATKVPALGEGAPNALIVRNEPEGDEPPIQAVALLSTGPQRWGGPYGRRPEFYTSPLLKSYSQCLSTAQRLLARRQTRQEVVAVTAAPDPRLQADDVVQLDWQRDNDSQMIRSLVRITDITHPLTPAAMSFAAEVIG